MLPHLHTRLYWKNLQEYFDYDPSTIEMPCGKCNKIHIDNKKTAIQIENRKSYIDNSQICHNKDCKTKHTIFIKKKKKLNPIITQIKYKNDYKQKLISDFIIQFDKILHEFGDTYLNKILKIRETKNKNKYKKKNKHIQEEINKLKEKHEKTCSEYEYVYALISSGKEEDILTLLDFIDYGELNLKDVTRECGSQCYCYYTNHYIL